ncbi:helicase with zinc finger domain 2 isoform X1 [Crotalus tigris]|uniref:helicase with zinc finger domain 2 isoform X1 n=1 Tax=Crotalus tigris TaxID=88082 RepID=UPI00192F92AA|nr:helicase with zinc finger domain 2 isoform X1 [Crotalus tigris]
MPHLNGMVPTLLDSLQSQVSLHLACSKCSQQANESTYLLKEVDHNCMKEILLARRKGARGCHWRKVDRRPSFPNPACYDVCRYYVPGSGCTKHHNTCTFAWSQEEVIVWTFERKYNVERRVLKWLLKQTQSGTGNTTAQPTDLSNPDVILSEFGGYFQEICRTCFYSRPQRICPRGSTLDCKNHWGYILVHVITGGKKKQQYTEIRPCPRSHRLFSYCPSVSAGKSCRNTSQSCSFAHSDVELAIWKAEQRQGLERANLLCPAVEPATVSPLDSGPQYQFYCRVCLVTCDSQQSFENHCLSMEHTQMIATDTLTEWSYRAPPYDPKTFALCKRPDICEYGQDCALAHSVQELEEWIQRAKIAERKKKTAKEDGLLAYQDRLITEYQTSHNEVLIMSEAVEGVRVMCQQPLRIQSENKKLQYQWVFTVHSQKPLIHVALLKRTPGASFHLAVPGQTPLLTYASGASFKTVRTSPPAVEVKVGLKSHTFGVYEQWLVFDFGSRPVLVQKLYVRLGQKEAAWRVDPANGSGSCFVQSGRGHTGNRVVVPSVSRTGKDVELSAKYKAPSLSMDFQRGARGKPITCVNYREEMHNFLVREEEAQQLLISKLNLHAVVSFVKCVEVLPSGLKFAPPGQLYAQVPTPYSLTMDSDAGYLLQRSVRTAFLAQDPPANNRVYEVSIEKEGLTERNVCLLLPQRCCMELGLQPDTRAKMEVQFQTDQLQFCQWHQAVDNLWDVKLVFPDVTICSIPHGSLQVPWGNAKQKQALFFITGQVTKVRRTPPLLIYGPFGTGKTFTLAKTTLEIIKKPQTRVLICTHTNSAADIYIREYFHNYAISSHPEAIPLRVKSTYRSVKATDPITLRYCCLSPSGEEFCLPTKEQIDRHRIVLTTCMTSRDLGLSPGYFTHILIDEAAQMLECEALVPLSLATLRTLIVLAGDHMQKTPRFYSLHKDEQSADYTLLNRLFQHYKKEQHEVATKSRIIFNENYRSTAGIIEFVSKHFYVGREDTIRAKGNIPPHPEFYPLMFCHVSGSAEKDRSMSWYNISEVEQIVEKVEEMNQKWPAEWGQKDLKSICVVSSGIQVKFIRDRLRKRGFSEVTVENDDNLPGREFRVIIINTIHTCNSLKHVSSSNLEYFNNARVLNTIITRAQSQVITVGDAVALCSHGQCSKIWKSFIKKCIEKKSITPENLTLEEIKQMVSDWASWNRGSSDCEEESSDTDSWVSDTESLNLDDPILQELLDESKEMMVTVNEEGLLKVKSNVSVPESRRHEYVNYSSQTMQRYLQMQPDRYKRCGFVQERFDQASAFTLDEVPSVTIQIKGRLNCGMAFTGDQVLVEILTPNATFQGNPRGKVVGILKEVERDLTFVCKVDEFDLRVMIPLDQSVTKIFVPPLNPEADRDAIPIRKIDQAGNIKLKGWKKITPENRKTCLFVVQIVKWKEGYYYPMGIVTEVLPLASSLEDGLRILDLEYCLSTGYPASVTSQVAKLISRHPSLIREERKDCRAHCTFTVDPLGTKDLDDAISVRDMGDKYEIGIHIADVASVISKDCPLDAEAKKRGSTYYAPEKEPIFMLPPQLSQNLFSLLPDKERLVISLFVVVDKATDHMERISFAVSIICSNRQMTYEEAEEIIKKHYKIEAPSPHFDTLEDCVAMAYHFSRVHRKSRLHEDYHYDQLDEEIPLGQRCSHQMIEEFMILFNSSVGDLLTNQDPTRNLTPLRCQMEPNPQQISQMQDKYREIIPLSTHLSHHLRVPTGDIPGRTSHPFVLLTSSWEHLKLAANDRDFAKILDLITTDDIHPKLAPINLEFRKLLNRSYFLRSNSCPQSKMGHYSLHVDSYTWATSPIRRYMDVVVQRHIISLISKKPIQYSQPEIEFICHDFNRKNSRANMYKRRVQSLELATQLKCQVQKKFAFIANIEGKAKNFKLLFPLNKETFPDSPCINYRALQLVSQPDFIEERNSMKLTWRRRVYSWVVKKEDNKKRSEIGGNVFCFQGDVWHEILAAVKNEDYEKLIHLLEKNYTLEPKCVGLMVRSKCLHYKELSVELKVGDVLNFQLTTDVQRGFLVPFVQLWTVAPGFEVCLEHTERPIDCFSKYTSQAPKDIYKDASDYRKVWLPLCDIEATLSALAENSSIVLQDIPILWKKQRTKEGQLCGTINLTKKFLKECSIEVDFGACYMCIRLSGLQGHGFQDKEVDLSQTFQQLSLSKETTKTGDFTIDPNTYTWVAHGCTDTFEENEKPDDRGEVMVNFYIHFTSMEKIPFEVTQKSSRFSVELIPKQLPDVRKEKAIWNLEYASKLAQRIALGQPIPTQRARPFTILKRGNFDIPGSSRKLNPSQQSAIQEALEKPFTLIQGPPGTGKTVVGAHIVYWFHQLNHEKNGNPTQPGAMPSKTTEGDASRAKSHILYCGPSHKSVDVVAEMLMRIPGYLKPLRVYGETIETMDFPYPGSNLQISRKAQRNAKSKPEIRSITLHYLIRGKHNPYSGRILAFDERVKRGEEITEDEIDRYKRLLNKARGFELERHEVVLCTCSASSSNFLAEHLQVKQVLIDECAMCTEPETLIPLAKYKTIEKVVLLGDHKQLRPVVHSDFCKKLKMERSLFERYHKQAGMLNIQYRMHKDICRFPSGAFYNHKLMTCPNIVRGSSTLYHRSEYECTPIIFGHVEGRERSLVVSTEEGNENSKANLEEMQHVVRIAKQLTLDRTTTPDQIAILTGYNAQVIEIKKQLALDGMRDVNVCTIMKSQGSEWKYVIVSTVRSCNRQEIDESPTKSWHSKYLGFVADPNQINVCLTRAQEGLCIIGNSYLLGTHSLWSQLLFHYKLCGCFTSAGEIKIKKRTSLRL